MQLLDGRKVAKILLEKVKQDVEELQASNIQPKLVVILVGDDPRSLSYIKQKHLACEQTGILYEQLNFPLTVTTEELIKKIIELNEDPKTHGILVQLPLPKSVSTPLIIRALAPKKDVDGFHAYNLGKMFLSTEFEKLTPCTPMGIIKLLEYYKIPIKGQDITVIGHSNIVGKPLAVMLLNRNATITVCHIDTKNVKEHTLKADMVISAVGKANLINGSMLKKGVVAIDVGCNRVGDKLCGDFDFDSVAEKASFITPVPGGVGPMTVACLMENLIKAADEQANMRHANKRTIF